MGGTFVTSKDKTKVISKYQPYFQNRITLLLKAKKGLQPQAVFDFMLVSDLPDKSVEFALNRSMKTFQNYKDKKVLLDPVMSERLLKLFSLYNKGAEIFGSIEWFSEWLKRPAYGIGNEIPHDILDTSTGIDLIYEELLRIEYGDLA